jgi:hypothetical protein
MHERSPSPRPSPGGSSRIERGLRILACLLPAACLGACADYVKHRDTVTFAAGEANAWNRTVHTTDPWPVHAWDTRIEGDGRRVERVIRRYSGEDEGAGTAQPQTRQGDWRDNRQDGAGQGAGE